MAPLKFKVPAASTGPLDIARGYIAAGIACFPCHEATIEEFDSSTGEFVERTEKSPRNSNGLRGATTSERIVNIWFGERYLSAAIGVPTGEPLGGWVLDLDRHGDRDGHLWLAEMEALHGPLPETARAKTANDGTHVFFKHVAGIRNKAAIAPGVDCRGQDGYVLAPGTVMADGRRYQWIDTKGEPYEPDGIPTFAEAPAWLLDLVLPRDIPDAPTIRSDYTYTPGKSEAYVERAVQSELERLASAPQGSRGHQLFASACALGEFVASGALSYAEAEAGLYQAAVASGVAAKDGDRITRSAIKRGLDKTKATPRQIPEREQDTTKPVDVAPLVANGLKKKADKKKSGAAILIPETVSSAVDDTPPPPSSTPTPPRTRERFEKTWFDNIEEGKPKETFIKGVFGLSEFTTVSGLPGTGKSVIVTDMACHVAAGREWHGRRVRGGLVVYVAAERKKLTERRMMAFKKRHGVADVPLLVIGGRLDFTRNLDDARALIDAIKEAELETGLSCIWVIVDTLTRVFGAGDQNASKDMTKFVQSCDEIIAETQAHVTAIHHTAWAGERMKGAIDLDGAVDASYMVKKDHGKYKLNCNGTNDGEEGDILTFTMDSVVLGVDEDGEPTTAPVVVMAAEPAKMTSGGAKGISAKVVAGLVDAIAAEGVEPDGPAFPDGVRVVKEEEWRAAFYAREGGKEDTMRKQFQRGKADLLADGLVRQIGQWYWPV